MIMSSDESKFNLFGTNRRIEEFALEEPLSKVAAERFRDIIPNMVLDNWH